MRSIGGLLLAFGTIAVMYAFSYDTSVYSSPTFIGGEMIGGGSTVNLGLLQKQMMILQTGLALIISGAIFVASDSVTVPSNVEVPTEYDDEDASDLANRKKNLAIFSVLAVLVIVALLFVARF